MVSNAHCHIRKHPYQETWNRPKDGTRGVQSNSFYFRVAEAWNALPTHVVTSENIDTFKERLDATWMDSPTKFTIDTQINADEEELFGEAF